MIETIDPFSNFGFRIWNLFVIWNLRFGASVSVTSSVSATTGRGYAVGSYRFLGTVSIFTGGRPTRGGGAAAPATWSVMLQTRTVVS